MKIIRTSIFLVLLNFVLVYSLTISKQSDLTKRKRDENIHDMKSNVTQTYGNKKLLRQEKNSSLEKFSEQKKFFLYGSLDEHYERIFFHFLIFFQLLNIVLFMWFFLQCLLNKQNFSLITRI